MGRYFPFVIIEEETKGAVKYGVMYLFRSSGPFNGIYLKSRPIQQLIQPGTTESYLISSLSRSSGLWKLSYGRARGS